jgi:DNA-binding MarR family transcriptional regulator
MAKLLQACAREVMETTPVIMRAIRVEMRRGHGTDLSIPQFRTLGFIQRNADASLTDVAEHLGLTPPSASKLVDGLVKQGLIVRKEAAADRRRITLELTKNGKSIVEAARASALSNLAGILDRLDGEQLQTIHQAMGLLYPLFAPQGRTELAGNRR